MHLAAEIKRCPWAYACQLHWSSIVTSMRKAHLQQPGVPWASAGSCADPGMLWRSPGKLFCEAGGKEGVAGMGQREDGEWAGQWAGQPGE